MKKKIVILLYIIFSVIYSLSIFAFRINFIYNGRYYSNIKVIDTKMETLDKPFYPMREVDQSQVHRLMLNSLEQSRLSTLQYVGDSMIFNNVIIKLLYNGKYKKYYIFDRDSGIKILFGLDGFNSIYLFSVNNFGDLEISKFDYFASAFSVKLLLKKFTGKIYKKETQKKKIGLNFTERNKEYDKLIQKLSNKSLDDVIHFLKKHIELNFDILPDNQIDSDWVNPVDLYFYRKGNYKSIAFFYYYTLKKLGYNIRSYLVCDLVKRKPEEIDIVYTKDPRKRLQLETQYNNVLNTSDIITKYYHNKPPDVFFYYPPKVKDSIFLITVQDKKKWLYTTGTKWVDAGLFSPKEACTDYMKGGYYYAYILQDENILNNYKLNESAIKWSVVYPDK